MYDETFQIFTNDRLRRQGRSKQCHTSASNDEDVVIIISSIVFAHSGLWWKICEQNLLNYKKRNAAYCCVSGIQGSKAKDRAPSGAMEAALQWNWYDANGLKASGTVPHAPGLGA